jgi:SynChlorMet cassette radical SAM/SPASM protein ScmF
MTKMSKEQEVEKENIPPLDRLYFYLTEGCNLACRHCWLSPKLDPTGDKYAILPIELFKTAIREAKPLGLNSVKLTGGEPLLHPHFTTMLEITRQEELALTIETNGVLCTPEIAEEIAKSLNRFVSVSMDGADATTHEWVRGVRGSFELARQAVSNLVAVGISPQIIFSVMPCNVGQVDTVVRMAEDLGASSVKFNIIQPIARGERLHKNDEALSIEALIKLGRHVEMELAKNTELTLFFDYPMAFRTLSRIASGDGCGVCGIIGILGVIASGHYALCGIGGHISELVLGKAGIDRLENVWVENPTLNELRSGLPDGLDGVCRRCLMKHRCLGSCIAQNYYRTGSFWGPYWFCEQAEERDLFPESRIGLPIIRA